ncbi:unnamed protein product [marine sediment metagenome]|jgi:hypothetical protein|uniref:Uncharacterized protein n=1 Tax=marine sediment metagenome TaxID=412755 RepID=X1GGP6_9ZZZZ
MAINTAATIKSESGNNKNIIEDMEDEIPKERILNGIIFFDGKNNL